MKKHFTAHIQQRANTPRIESKHFFSPALLLPILIAATISGCGGGEPQGDGNVYTISGEGLMDANASTSGRSYDDAVEVSGDGRAAGSIQSNKITISATERTAGAISSIQWQGKEFINNYDHGRQMQYAWQYGNYGECSNPTEAGSSADGTGRKSSSTIKSVSINSNSLHTITAPASWLNCGPSVSSDLIEKLVTIENGLIKSVAKITAQSLDLPIRLEAPTIYLSPEFDHFYTVEGVADRSSCLPVDYNEVYWQKMQGCDISEPIIAATQDGAFAIGLYTVPTGERMTYAFYHLSTLNAAAPNYSRAKKIGVYVHRQGGRSSAEITSYVAVGNLPSVRAAIADVRDRSVTAASPEE